MSHEFHKSKTTLLVILLCSSSSLFLHVSTLEYAFDWRGSCNSVCGGSCNSVCGGIQNSDYSGIKTHRRLLE